MKKQVEYLQKFFHELWSDFGSVYLLVKYSDRTRIGRRGFTEEEKKGGLVLVFNNRTNNSLNWDDEGNISCVLAFGATREDVLIHHDDLQGVFSPEGGMQFLRTDISREAEPVRAPEPEADRSDDGQIVSLNKFKSRKRKPGGSS